MRTLLAAICAAAVAACGPADGDRLGQPAPVAPPAPEHSARDVYAVPSTAPEGDAPAQAHVGAAMERCLDAPGVSGRREVKPPARYIVSLTTSATGTSEACIRSVQEAALTAYVPDEGGLQPGQQVAVHHCGVVNVEHEGQQREVEAAPFDGTNAPDTFSGYGSFARRGEQLLFSDDKGTTLTFAPWDGTPDAYGCA